MLNNLIFSLNATLPIFLIMVLGYILKKINMLDEHSIQVLNKLVFRVFLPALLFRDLAKIDIIKMWDNYFVLFCSLSTLISILICLLLSRLFKNTDKGEFIQASYRSAAATLGIAFMTNIYNSTAMIALMIIASVPIYNIAAVIVLSLTSKEASNSNNNAELLKKTLLSIAKNPIILGILVGCIWSLLKIPQPVIFNKSVGYLADLASPLALLTLGAAFEFEALTSNLKAIIAVNFNKLILFCIIFLPIAIYMDFRDEKLVSALIMLGSATTSSSYIMAKNMGHEGSLSSCSVMTTTLFASFTLTFWLFILKTMNYI